MMKSVIDPRGLSAKEIEEKIKSIDCATLSEKLADELSKSPLSSKIKIISIDMCFGLSGVYTDNKFSINIKGTYDKADTEECDYLKGRFVSFAEEMFGSKKSAEDLINYFWDVKENQKFAVGSKLDTIEGNFNQHGNKVKVQHEEGRAMLIDIWATWCGYCVKPMDHNMTLQSELKDYPIDFVGISCDQDNAHRNWVDFVKTKKWNQIQQYRNKNIMNMVGIQGIPHVLLVNSQGDITFSGHPSSVPNLKETLISLTKVTNDQKNDAENSFLNQEDPNPQWGLNTKQEREELVSAINDILLGSGVQNVRFVVSTKVLYSNGVRKAVTHPLFSGYLNQDEYEVVQGIATMVADDFGLKDVQYKLKLLLPTE